MIAKNESGPVYLVGIVDDLSDYKGNLAACLPVIKYNNDTIAVALKLGWNYASDEHVFKFLSESIAREESTFFDLSTPITVQNDQVVALIGPDFIEQAQSINISYFTKALNNFTPIKEGFYFCLMTPDEYDAFSLAMIDFAKTVFDQEIRRNKTTISESARSALLLLDGNASINIEYYYIRVLAAAYIEQQADLYREAIEFAIAETGETRGTILDWLYDYLELQIGPSVSLETTRHTQSRAVHEKENSKWYDFCLNVAGNRILQYSYPGYIQGQLFDEYVDRPDHIFNLLDEMTDEVRQTMELPEDYVINTDWIPPDSLNNLVDEALDQYVFLAEIGYATTKRRKSSDIYSLGTIEHFAVLTSPEFANKLPQRMAVPKHNRDAVGNVDDVVIDILCSNDTPLSSADLVAIAEKLADQPSLGKLKDIFRVCINHNIRVLYQNSTVLDDELSRIYTEFRKDSNRTHRLRHAVKLRDKEACSALDLIVQSIRRSPDSLYPKGHLAVLDWITGLKAMLLGLEKKSNGEVVSHLKLFKASYDTALDVGFFYSTGDEYFHHHLEQVVKRSLYNDGVWDTEFAKLAQGSLVDLKDLSLKQDSNVLNKVLT